MISTITTHRTSRRLSSLLLATGLALGLTACETPLNTLRAKRLSTTEAMAPTIAPRALALALQVSPDELALTPASLSEANAMLNSQGRLSTQILTITPLSDKGVLMAPKLAAALKRSGAPTPNLQAKPADEQRLAQAASQGWDLELQSDAMVVSSENCAIAKPTRWMLRPYDAVGPLGCASRNNIAAMISDPRDLLRPRTLDGGNGAAAALAVDRYQHGQIRDLIDIDFSNN